METIVHATKPEKVLGHLLCVLKPGGRIAMHEYDHLDCSESQKALLAGIRAIYQVSKQNSMLRYETLSRGVLPSMLER